MSSSDAFFLENQRGLFSMVRWFFHDTITSVAPALKYVWSDMLTDIWSEAKTDYEKWNLQKM